MPYPVYDVAMTLAAPAVAAWLGVHPNLRPLMGRFSPKLSRPANHPLWFHGCSVGEITVAASLITNARERWPECSVMVTSSTIAGRRRASELLPDIPFAWFPFDHRSTVRGFLRRVNPRMLVLVETEIWPNVIRHARLSRTPVLVANGRISDRHYPRYLRFKWLLHPVFEQITAVCVQNQTYAERFESVGVPPARIRVTGSTKFDRLEAELDAEKIAAVRRETGLDSDGPVIVFGSTRPGDEALAAAVWRELRESFPSARLILAPRHLERVQEVSRFFDEPIGFRSKGGLRHSNARVLIVDTHGELVSFYALADVAVVGGSFCAEVNGHNPLEPAAMKTPVVFGPHMRNFMDPAEALVSHEGAIQLANPDALADTLVRLLKNPSERAALVQGAQDAIAVHQGATRRTLDIIGEVLDRNAV